MREIVLDTETTGLDPAKGDRITEIGCVELMNHVATGRTFHTYLNPQREVHPDAVAISGLTLEFLSQHPTFDKVAGDFLAFIGSAPLIIHNAKFDIGFLNAELALIGLAPIPLERATDTVLLARKKFPGSPASLDALCKRFNIDNSKRTLHGALLDSQLLAECYLELLGGRQPNMVMGLVEEITVEDLEIVRTFREPRPHTVLEEELFAHEAMLEKIKDALWKAY